MLRSTPRRLAIATAAVFLISLVVAGFVKNTNTWPKIDQNVQDASYRATLLWPALPPALPEHVQTPPDAPEMPPGAISGCPGQWSDIGKVLTKVADRLSL
jgi:hypothetical protein